MYNYLQQFPTAKIMVPEAAIEGYAGVLRRMVIWLAIILLGTRLIFGLLLEVFRL
jgi:preprotein translocase subunit SecG